MDTYGQYGKDKNTVALFVVKARQKLAKSHHITHSILLLMLLIKYQLSSQKLARGGAYLY